MPAFSKLQQGISQFHSSFLNHLSLNKKIANFPQIQSLISPMVTASGSTKRPTCPSCSKPASICLCTRLRTPVLNNSVSVTIFQHCLEKNHPLNSTRIAKIGLKNVDIVTVSDVNFEAQFFIQSLDSRLGDDGVQIDESAHMFDEMPERSRLCHNAANSKDFQLCAFDFTIAVSGTITSINNCKMGPDEIQEMSFDQLLASGAAVDGIRKGFVVKKLKLLEGFDECEEYEIAVPSGSALLFPSESSVGAETIDFEVKNLIVLDGTWAKAKRMYKENPWLRLLPHIRLDLDKLSLYNEVRTQPRAGYLSTIESIVYAMKAVGEEDEDGLDDLLVVFESMVEDQRRCKDERMRKPLGE